MTGRRAVMLGVGIGVGALIGWFVVGALAGGPRPIAPPEIVDTVAGAALYQEHCATCHGADLGGQPDWQSPAADGGPKAPPHDASGHTWHHGDALLFTYTRLGGAETLAQQGIAFESNMPGFGDVLSDQEIWNILGFIKSTWPDRVREAQAARSEAERL